MNSNRAFKGFGRKKFKKFNKNANFYHNFAKIAKKYLGLQMDKKASQNPHLTPKKRAKKQKNAPKISNICHFELSHKAKNLHCHFER